MVVTEYQPPSPQGNDLFAGIDLWGILKSVLPYVLLVVVLGAIAYGFWYYYINRKKPMPDYNKEVYKKLYSQLLMMKLNKGMGKVFFSLAFVLLGFLIGGWVFEGNLPFSIISALMLYFISKVITTGFSHKFEVETYLYDKDYDKFGTMESSFLLTGDGLKYMLVSRGKPAMFFPQYDIVALPAQKSFKFITTDKLGKEKTVTGVVSDFDRLMVKNERGDVMVNCKNFEKHNYYYFPVLNLKAEGKDTSLFSFREIAFNINKALLNEIAVYDLLNENYKNVFKAVNANPMIRAGIKAKDIDIEDSTPQMDEPQM